MNGKLTVLSTFAVLAAVGCSIPLSDGSLFQTNLCSSDSDCQSGSVCAHLTESSLCASTTADLPAVVFEVRPAAAAEITAPSLIGPVDITSLSGPSVIDLPLAIPQYVDVSPGRVYLPCAGEDPVPAKVSLVPIPDYSGLLEQQAYEAEPTLDESGKDAFHVKVPPGKYDVYIEPHPDIVLTPDCAGAPPIYLPAMEITKDAGFAIHASEPFTVVGTLKLSQKEDFTKWHLELVEPNSGQTISDVIQPEQNGIDLEVPFQLRFDWSARKQFTPLLRLRPPDASGKPVIHWNLAAVASSSLNEQEVQVKLDLSGVDTQPRKVSGQVFHDTLTVPATVTLRSKGGSGGDLVRFETSVATDPFGRFEATVPRREYTLIARPYSDDFAFGVTDWDTKTGEDCFCGNAVEVPSATTLAGSVTAPTGEIVEAEARVTPTASVTLPYLGSMLDDEIPPRPASALTENGHFQLHVDGGTFDFSIAAPQSSGYPWLVRPRQIVALPTADAAPVVSLDPFQLQMPAIVRGTVTGADGQVLPGATVRAWIGVSDPKNPKAPPSAVQIAETVADDQGVYVLLLPPSIKQGN